MSEWGPWIEHDGKGCPCMGQWVQVEERDHGISPPRIAGGMFDGTEWWTGSSWHWAVIPYGPDGVEWDPIIRYRIRKPRGLTILENLIADLPAPARKVDAQVPALVRVTTSILLPATASAATPPAIGSLIAGAFSRG